MKIKQWMVAALGLLLALGFGACGGGSETSGLNKVVLAGSTTVQPLAEVLAGAYGVRVPTTQVDVQGGGSSVGVKSAVDHSADIGMASRVIKDSELEEFPQLASVAIAMDGIAVVVNPGVNVDSLTIEEVAQIFAGEITNWEPFTGQDMVIITAAREEGSGTRDAFESMVMDGKLVTDRAILQPSNGSIVTTVSTTPGSISFISFGYISEDIKVVRINDIDASAETVLDGSYPLARPLNFVLDGSAEGEASAFINFVLSDEGQAIVLDEGYIPVH